MTTLAQLLETQANKSITVNENFEAVALAGLFGVKRALTVALTFAYYGGVIGSIGAFTTIADGTLTLTASATNYIEATTAGAVSSNTSAFTAGRIPLYVATTSTTGISALTDYRVGVGGFGPLAGASLTISGNATIGGTLNVVGDFSVATNKFTVAAASGNTVVAGTLGVTGAVSLSGLTTTTTATEARTVWTSTGVGGDSSAIYNRRNGAYMVFADDADVFNWYGGAGASAGGGAGTLRMSIVSGAVTILGTLLLGTASVISALPGSGEIGLANSAAIRWKNAAGTANINGIYVDASNDLQLGAGTRNTVISTSGLGIAMTIANTTGAVTIAGTGPHAIGTTAATYAQWKQGGAFTGASGETDGWSLESTLTANAGDLSNMAVVAGSITTAGSGTNSIISGLKVVPTFVVTSGSTVTDLVGTYFAIPAMSGAGTTTNATTVKINGAPASGTTKRALWVVAGNIDFGTGTITSNGSVGLTQGSTTTLGKSITVVNGLVTAFA